MVVTVVMIAGFKRIFQLTIKISLQYIINFALTSSDNCDAVSRKLVVGSHAHVASQHLFSFTENRALEILKKKAKSL